LRQGEKKKEKKKEEIASDTLSSKPLHASPHMKEGTMTFPI